MAAAAFACASLPGCAAPRAAPPATGPSASELAGRAARAWASGDPSAFGGLFVPGLGDRLWETLRLLGATAVEGTAEGLRVTWPVPGGTAVVVQGLPCSASGGRLLPATRPPAPVWVAGAVRVSTAPGAALVADATVDAAHAARWLAAAAEASALVGDAALGQAAEAWDGVLLVDLPAQQNFSGVAGLGAGQASGTQAATIMDAAGSAPRVVGNLAAEPAGAALRTLLVHEGVHAATRAAVSAAPLWLVEGVAESVACATDPAARARGAELIRGAPRPSALPTRADLDAPDAERAYAFAALAADAAIARWGRPAVMGWLADWGRAARPSDAELAACFRAAPRG